jgi:hypothetical protein
VQLAQCGRIGILTLVDPALGHLPCMAFVDVLGTLGAAAYEHPSGPIEHGHADARPVRQMIETRHIGSL